MYANKYVEKYYSELYTNKIILQQMLNAEYHFTCWGWECRLYQTLFNIEFDILFC